MCHCSCTKIRAPQNSDFRLIWMQTVCPRQQFAIEYLRVRMSRSKDFMNYSDYEARIVSEYSTNVFLQHKMHSTRVWVSVRRRVVEWLCCIKHSRTEIQ